MDNQKPKVASSEACLIKYSETAQHHNHAFTYPTIYFQYKCRLDFRALNQRQNAIKEFNIIMCHVVPM